MLIWLVTGAIFHFSHRWLLLLSTGTSIVSLLILFLILTGHQQKTHMLSEKLNQLRDDLKTEDEMILRKLHAKHRNGQDS